MKFYSDELKRFFNTEEACLAAEETARQEAKEKNVTKAKLAKDIEEADKAIDEAYAELDKANEAVQELRKEYDAKVDAIMNPARENLQKCLTNRRDAIRAFNDKFGVYTTTYRGSDAVNEWIKTTNLIDTVFNRFWY